MLCDDARAAWKLKLFVFKRFAFDAGTALVAVTLKSSVHSLNNKSELNSIQIA